MLIKSYEIASFINCYITAQYVAEIYFKQIMSFSPLHIQYFSNKTNTAEWRKYNITL